MICPKCKNALMDNSVFCQYCGINIKEWQASNRVCPSCGRVMPEGSLFCPYCTGEPDEPIISSVNSQNTSQPTADLSGRSDPHRETFGDYPAYTAKQQQQQKKPKTAKRFIPLILVGLALIGAVAEKAASNNDTPTRDYPTDNLPIVTPDLSPVIDLDDASSVLDELPPVIEPYSGCILSGEEGTESSITISTSGSPYVVKLKDVSGEEVLSFYVRANDTVEVGVPGRFMYVYFATGNVWYGEEHLFGENTQYSKDDEGADFLNYTMQYTLYPVADGNFATTDIGEDEF